MNTSSSEPSYSNLSSSAASAVSSPPLPDAAHFEQLVIGSAARPKPHRLLPLLCFTLVLSAGTYVVLRRSHMNSELRLAVMQHDVPQVRRLLAWGADPNLRYDGQTSDETSLWSGLFPGTTRRPPANLYKTHKTLLMSAVTSGRADLVAALLEHGADVNVQLPNGQTALLFATTSHSPTIAPMLLARGAHWNVRDSQGRTPFLNAAEEGNTEAVREILDKGGNIEETDADQQSALCLASAKRHENIVQLLLDHGARVDSLTNALINPSQYRPQNPGNGFAQPRPPQMPPLLWAAGVGSPSLLTTVWDKHMNDSERTQYGVSALNMAVQSGNETTVRALLARNVPVEPTFAGGFSPLASAAGAHNLSIMRLLLEKGARVNPAQTNQITPLMAAAGNMTFSYMPSSQIGQQTSPGATTEMVQMLLDRGANVNAQDAQGKTPLMCAVNSPEVTRMLLEHGAQVNAHDHRHSTALLQANNAEVIKLLLDHGADAHDVDRSGNPLLTRTNDPVVTALLIAKGADVNATDFAGATPLMRSMSDKFTALILSHGANVNARDRQNSTALHQAVRMQQKSIVSLLLQHGADVNAADKSGQTPLSIAKQFHQQPILDMLTTAEARH